MSARGCPLSNCSLPPGRTPSSVATRHFTPPHRPPGGWLPAEAQARMEPQGQEHGWASAPWATLLWDPQEACGAHLPAGLCPAATAGDAARGLERSAVLRGLPLATAPRAPLETLTPPPRAPDAGFAPRRRGPRAERAPAAARTARGRCLNDRGWKHLGLAPPSGSQTGLFDEGD